MVKQIEGSGTAVGMTTEHIADNRTVADCSGYNN